MCSKFSCFDQPAFGTLYLLWAYNNNYVVYLLILLTGVVGNVVTCIVIARNSYMHNATNCYLFSLAISDTFQLVLGTWPTSFTLYARTTYSFYF